MRILPVLLASCACFAGEAAPPAKPATKTAEAVAAPASQADQRAARRLIKDAEEKIQLAEPDAAIAIYERVLEK